MNKTCLICKKEIDKGTCPYCGYKESTEYDPHHLPAGTNLSSGKYSVGNVVGAGGFGVTYSAWDHALDRHVAVKEYMPGEFSTRMPGNTFITVYGGEKAEQFAGGMDKFLDESRRLAKFTETPGIVQIYDCFQENNTAYIVMEYLEGETLAERIDREGKIPVKDAVDIMIPVLDALETVHAEGIIHRDIAPNNIFLTNDGKVKLLDFGAARSATGTHSKSLTVLYKEGYTAEEQYLSRGDQGPWTDVYAAAATLYKAITGITPEGAMERRLDDKVKAPSKTGVNVPVNIDSAIMNALNLNLKNRTGSAVAFREELLSKKRVRRHFQKTREHKVGRIPIPIFVISGLSLTTALVLLLLLRLGIIEFHEETFENLFVQPGKARVMNVVNMEADEAERRLAKIGLNLEITDYKYDNSVQIGRIISQEEEKGEIVDDGSNVHVVVSCEAQIVQVPDVLETEESEALKDLEALGLDYKIIEKNAMLPPGYISECKPVPGKDILQGSCVTLCVSSGFKDYDTVECEAEDYSGRNFSDLRKQLSYKGIYLLKGEKMYDDNIPKLAVISQNVVPGEVLHSGDIIVADISMGIEQREVPNLKGMTREEAQECLKGLDLSYIEISVIDHNYEEGTVVSQSVAAGKEVDKYTEIRLSVAAQGYEIPSLTGLSREQAESLCQQNGYAINIKEVRGGNGTVKSQNPQAGEYVLTRGTVNVEIGIPDAQYNRMIEDQFITSMNQFLSNEGQPGNYRTDNACNIAQACADYMVANGSFPDSNYIRGFFGSNYGYSVYYRRSGSYTSFYQLSSIYSGSQIGFGYIGNDIRVIMLIYR